MLHSTPFLFWPEQRLVRPHRFLNVLLLSLPFSSLLPVAAHAQVAAEESLRLTSAVTSPWGKPLGTEMPQGARIKLTATALDGPAPLKCTDAVQRFLRTTADGLFEGNLPAPADESARRLGMPDHIVSQRISCSSGSFDLHRSAEGRAWIGLDNVVLQWERTHIAASPEAIVQSLLIQHMSSDMALSREHIERQRDWLNDDLVTRFGRWFTRTASRDEAPYLNGDPYTDSQEPPDSFELSPASVSGDAADVAVTFRGADDAPYAVHYLLSRTNGAWRIDDLRYRDGEKLSQLLER